VCLQKVNFNTFLPLTVARDERKYMSISENMFRNHVKDLYNYMDIMYTFLGKFTYIYTYIYTHINKYIYFVNLVTFRCKILVTL
jgi:hypothetical protein